MSWFIGLLVGCGGGQKAGHNEPGDGAATDVELGAPAVVITNLDDLSKVPVGALVEPVASVSDGDNAFDALHVSWTVESETTGQVVLLGSGPPSSTGTTSTQWWTTEADRYILAVTVEDDEGLTGSDEVVLEVVAPEHFDADEDGWTPNQGDCDDTDPTLSPAQPESCDVIDNDCNGEVDDKDLDADYHVDGACAAYAGSLPVDDCDDSRSDTWPGALEILGDGLDQDCAGDPDTSVFGFGDGAGDFDWTNPTNPEITRLNDQFLLLVGAESGSVPLYEEHFGVALPFALPNASGGAVPDHGPHPYWNVPVQNLEVQPPLDVALDPSPTDLDGDGIPDPVVRTASMEFGIYTYLVMGGIALETASGRYVAAGGGGGVVPAPYTANGLDLVIDGDGDPFALTCGVDLLLGLHGIIEPATNTTTSVGGDACFFDGQPTLNGGGWEAPFQLCAAGSCVHYVLDAQASFLTGSPAAERWAFGDLDEGWISLIDTVGNAYVQEPGSTPVGILGGKNIVHLDVDEADGKVYAAAVDDAGDVWLAFGDLAAGLTELPMAFNDPSVLGETAVKVAIYADVDRVAVAVTATTGRPGKDSVGWTFLGPAP